jgi:predicted transcriptional regulator
MRKTSVYLSDEDTERLEWLANREGRSRANVIREALLLYAERGGRRGDRDFAGAGIAEGPGDSIADLAEDEMLRGFGSDSYPGHRGDHRPL